MFLKFSRRQKHIQNLSDEGLIDALNRSGDNDYLGELFNRYTHLVFGACLKYLKNAEESKDAVMQIFEELPEKLSQHEVKNFKSWIYSVTRNHCLMDLRRKGTEKKAREDIYQKSRQEFMESLDLYHPIVTDDKNELMTRLNAGIEQLKKEQQTCIKLIYLQNKSYSDVAKITGYDLKKVKSYIQNGKRNLRIFIENK